MVSGASPPHNARMARKRSGMARRWVVAAVLLTPLVVDPFGHDTTGLKLSLLTLAGLAALAIKGVELWGGSPSLGRTRAPELCLLGLTAWSALSMGWADNPTLAQARTLTLLGMFGVAWGVREVVPGPAAARRWLGAMALVGLLAMGIDAVFVLRRMGELEASQVKYASTVFVHNNMAASFAIMLAPVTLSLALGASSRARRLGWLLATAGVAGCLLLLRSRAGLAGIVLGGGLVVLLHGLRPRLASWRPSESRWTPVLGLAVTLAALAPLSETLRGLAKSAFYWFVGLTGFGLQDVGFRFDMWAKTIEMVGDRPLRGVGAGNFPVAYAAIDRYAVAKPHAHNDALAVLVELGLPGLALFLGLLATSGWILLRVCARRAAGPDFTTAVALLAALAVFVLSGVFEIPFGVGSTAAWLALLIGLASVLDGPDGVAIAPRSLRWPLGLVLLLVTVPALWTTLQRLPGSYHTARGEAALAGGDLDAAQAAFTAVAALPTGSDIPHQRLGLLALRRGDPAAALEHFRAAARLWPHGERYLEYQADALLELGRGDEAVELYTRCLELAPSRREPLFKLVDALQRSGRHAEAVARLTHEVASDPLIDPQAYWELAWAWRRQAEELPPGSDDWVAATAAARHFFAVYIVDGDPSRHAESYEAFGHLTHRLQTGSAPDQGAAANLARWWAIYYDDWLKAGGWDLPAPALYSSMGPDGQKLFPGWVEPEGPPLPRSMRP